MRYTPEQYKRMEMEKQAGPLANQVFQPVQVTQVPPPPRAQEPQITPQQQQPGIGQQFGQAMATKMITKGVDAVTGLPIMSTIFAEKGTKVPSWKEYQKMQRSMGTPYGKEKAKDWYINKSKEQMNVAPSSSPSPSYAARGDEVPHTDDDKDPLTWLYEKPGPRLPAPRPQAIGPLAQALPPGITSTDMQILQFYGVDPFKASIEDAEHYGNMYEYQYGGMEFHPLADPDRYNKGGNVTYAEEGMRVRMPLAKPIEMDESYITKGMPKQLRPPLATDEWANYTQKLPMNTDTFYVKQGKQKPSEESYWQKAERTGLFGVPGTQNVYVDPGKGTIAYQREDVKPFTWMWNKGRNFLGFGAPLAERSE